MGMLPFLIAGLAAGAVLLIAVGVAMSGGSGGVASRLERYARAQGAARAESPERSSAVLAGVDRALDSQGMAARLSVDIARADLKLRPSEFVVAWALGWAPAARGTRLGEAFFEAGQQTQDTAVEFWEWLRLGR